MIYWLISVALLILGVWFLFDEMASYSRDAPGTFWRNPALISKVFGLTLGILIRLAASVPPLAGVFVAMSVGFLFLTPFVIGFVSTSSLPGKDPLPWKHQLLGPWLPSSTALLLAGCLGFEGAICLLMALPLWLVLATLGGASGAFYRSRRTETVGAYATVLIAVPLAVSAWESRLPAAAGFMTTSSEILIAAPPAAVWREIASVPLIRESERPVSFASLVGFPAPLAATLEGSGVGAVRRAGFSGGLEFLETVTDWNPEESIAFDIRANTKDVPAATLDRHVSIGGEYFDVLRGRYDIERLASGETRLLLRSEHRLTTRFNWYSEIWANLIMGSIQRQILSVIKTRAEENAAASSRGS